MGYDLEPEIQRVLIERQTVDMATGMLMQTNQLTATQAAWRLRHMAEAFHVSLPDMATVVIDTRT